MVSVSDLPTSFLEEDDGDDGDDGTRPAVEDEEVDEDPPTEENLKALEKFSEALLGSPYEENLTQLMDMIYPSAIESIREVLWRHWPRGHKTHGITCIIDWQFLEYLMLQNITFSKLEPTFTITGKPSCCGVATLGTYVASTWGEQLLNILRDCYQNFRSLGDCSTFSSPALENQVENVASYDIEGCTMQLFYQDKLKRFTKSIAVTLTGMLDNVSKILEQFAWLASTLREADVGNLTISEIQFQAIYPETDDDIRTTKPSGYSSLPFIMEIRKSSTSLQANSKNLGQCWAQFFSRSILAYGFPLPSSDRPGNALGLEIPFNIMAAFIGDLYPVMFDNRLAFANESVILVSQTFVENSIQWHIEDIEDVFRHVEESKHPMVPIDPALESIDISTLISCRAFFGHCTFAEVLLGTKEFLNVEPLKSGVPPARKEARLKKDFTLGLNISALGFATLQSSGAFRFSSGEVEQIEGNQLHPQSRIRRAKSSSVVLYDQKTKTAFLVSELSVALQMSITYLRTNTKLEVTRFPFASLQADGGQAAYQAIIDAQNLDILPYIGTSQKLYDIVCGFLRIYEQLRAQRRLERANQWTMSFGKGLKGWDYADIQAEEYDLEGQGLVEDSPPIWWELFRTYKTLVLFTRIGLPLVRASQHGKPHCQAWDDYPTKRDILVAPIAQLLNLKEKLCTPTTTHQPRYMLNDDIYWARPLHRRLFDDPPCHIGGMCNPIQTMLLKKENDPRYGAGPGRILTSAPHGAVLFAQDPDKIPARSCKLALPLFLPPKAEDDSFQEICHIGP